MANYYVKLTGSDSADGLTDDTAWLTVAKVNATTFAAGDVVHFARGGTWRETLAPACSGSAGNPVTFTAYGTGANPVICGSALLTPWQIPASQDAHNDHFVTADYDATYWTLTGTAGYIYKDSWTNFGITGPAGSGDYGLKLTGNIAGSGLAGIGHEFAAPVHSVWLECHARTPADGAKRVDIFSVYDDQATPAQLFTLRYGATSALIAFTRGGSSTQVVGSLSAATWYKVRVQVECWANAKYRVNVWIDTGSGFPSQPQYTATPTIAATAITGVKRIFIGNIATQQGEVSYFDDLRVSYASFDAPIGVYSGTAWRMRPTQADTLARLYISDATMGDQQANLAAVNSAGDWFRDDSATRQTDTVYWYDDPTGKTVEIPTADNACIACYGGGAGRSYLTYDSSLTFKHAQGPILTMYNPDTANAATGIKVFSTVRDGMYGCIAVGQHITSWLIFGAKVSGGSHAGIFINSADGSGNVPTSGTIAFCLVTNNQRQGITLEQCSNVDVLNNVIDTVTSDGQYSRGIEIMGNGTGVGVAGTVRVWGNTVLYCTEHGMSLNPQDENLVLLDVRNNLVRSASVGEQACSMSVLNANKSKLLLDYNVLTHLTPGETVASFGGLAYTVAQLADFRTALATAGVQGAMAHGAFTATAQLGLDYFPMAGGAADGTGDASAVNSYGTDIYGRFRQLRADRRCVGAVELQRSAPENNVIPVAQTPREAAL